MQAPVLISPIGSVVGTGWDSVATTKDFLWEEVPGAAEYEVEITIPTFGSCKHRSTGKASVGIKGTTIKQTVLASECIAGICTLQVSNIMRSRAPGPTKEDLGGGSEAYPCSEGAYYSYSWTVKAIARDGTSTQTSANFENHS